MSSSAAAAVLVTAAAATTTTTTTTNSLIISTSSSRPSSSCNVVVIYPGGLVNKPRVTTTTTISSSTRTRLSFNSKLILTAAFLPTTPIPASSVAATAAAAAASSEQQEEEEEPATKVKFQTLLTQLPAACSSQSLSLLGTGYREKVFAIIGVKVYAAGLYANPSIFSKLDAWKGRSAAELQQDSSLFNAIFQAPLEKLLHIILVRDIDGKTFWGALDEAISPRIKSPAPDDESALSKFRTIFQGKSLKKGTSIFLTWLDSTKMLVCVSSDPSPSSVDATIESANVASALFDVFLGDNPVSPSLKASASKGLAASLIE